MGMMRTVSIPVEARTSVTVELEIRELLEEIDSKVLVWALERDGYEIPGWEKLDPGNTEIEHEVDDVHVESTDDVEVGDLLDLIYDRELLDEVAGRNLKEATEAVPITDPATHLRALAEGLKLGALLRRQTAATAEALRLEALAEQLASIAIIWER